MIVWAASVRHARELLFNLTAPVRQKRKKRWILLNAFDNQLGWNPRIAERVYIHLVIFHLDFETDLFSFLCIGMVPLLIGTVIDFLASEYAIQQHQIGIVTMRHAQ